MKLERKIGCGILLLGVLGITPLCSAETASDQTSIEDVKKETEDLLRALGQYSAGQKDEAIRKTKSALDQLDERIESLENRLDERWDKMDQTAREKARANLRKLRKQRTEVAEWYGSLKGSTSDAWEHMKKGFSDAYKALTDAWERSEREFELNNK